MIRTVLSLPDAPRRWSDTVALNRQHTCAQIHARSVSWRTSPRRRPATLSRPNKQWYVHGRNPPLPGSASAAWSKRRISASE